MPEKQQHWQLSVLVVIALLFLYALTQLFFLRFSRGDVYPPYSSLRADPLGLKVLYESMRRLENLRVERNYLPLTYLTDPEQTTLLVAGAKADHFVSETRYRTLDMYVIDGARLVYAFHPVAAQSPPARAQHQCMGNEKNAVTDPQDDRLEPTVPASEPHENKEQDELRQNRPELQRASDTSIEKQWGFRIGNLPNSWIAAKKPQAVLTAEAAARYADAGLNSVLPWHSSLYFSDLDSGWQTVYAVDDKAVVIAKNSGSGQLLLCADSFMFSNEAMRDERQTSLLAWLMGENARVVFEETHLGVLSVPGIAGLMRKYRLHGLPAALLLLAILFVWKSSCSLVPAQSDAPESAATAPSRTIAGRHSRAGLVNLLCRNIPTSELLRTCLDEWERSGLAKDVDSTAKIRRLCHDATGQKEQSPAALYRRISEILAERK